MAFSVYLRIVKKKMEIDSKENILQKVVSRLI